MRNPEDVIEELTAFACQHNLVLPQEACLKAHAARYVQLGRCPCDDRRSQCPCDEALEEIEAMGRCECGVLVDPMRIFARDKRADKQQD